MARQGKSSRLHIAISLLESLGDTVSYEDRKSTWTSGVRKAIRPGSAKEVVHKHRDHVTGAREQNRKQRRRVNVSYDQSMVTALQRGAWMDDRWSKIQKDLYQREGQNGGIHHSLYGAWVADFMLRQDAKMMMIAFITIKSSLVPSIEGLCAQI